MVPGPRVDPVNNEWVNPLRDANDRRLPRIAGPSVMVMFGVTGDLARKKLLPAIYDLANRGILPPGFGLVGFARRDWDDEQFRGQVREDVRKHARTGFDDDVWTQLSAGIHFVQGTFDDTESFTRLRDTLDSLARDQGSRGNTAYYLSIPPGAFGTVIDQLRAQGLHDQGNGWKRVVIEKPFGHDLVSAKVLAEEVSRAFPPEAVFRIDHYLGKETVQNLLAFRFSNLMYEPIWNNRYLSHVQITQAEDIGIGSRAGYYDGIGAARDVIQNHLLQLMALTAMEEPNSFEAGNLRIEKQKVLSAARPPHDLDTHTANGQYAAGWQGGRYVGGYLDEDGIDANSTTETYAAIRVDIDSRRWAGVPFYLRTAKRMPRRVTEIALMFKRAPHLPFNHSQIESLGTNALVLRIQPNEGISVNFGAKVPATPMEIRQVSMNFDYSQSFSEASPEAYERLILDVLLGDPPLFPQQEEVELSWRILDPVLQHWASKGQPEQYAAGTWGPSGGVRMLAADGHVWRRP